MLKEFVELLVESSDGGWRSMSSTAPFWGCGTGWVRAAGGGVVDTLLGPETTPVGCCSGPGPVRLIPLQRWLGLVSQWVGVSGWCLRIV